MLRLKLFICSLTCRDMGFRSRPNRFFSLLKSMSRPQKHVATLFLPILSQPYFLVTTVLLTSASLYGHDLKSMSLLNGCPYHLCSCYNCPNLVARCFNRSAHFYVTTSIGVLSIHFCRNIKFPGRELASPFSSLSWSQHHLSVATNNVFFLCRDLKTVSRHDLSLKLLLSWSQQIFSYRNSFFLGLLSLLVVT